MGAYSWWMRLAVQAAIAWLLCACGARTELGAPARADGGGAGDAIATCPAPETSACDAGPAEAGACGPLAFDMGTTESCALTHAACVPVDLEGFAPFTCPFAGSDPCAATGPGPQEVFALNRYGAGHLVAWCDTTSLLNLLALPPILAYLGRDASPRIAGVGTYPCNLELSFPGTFLGESLPQKYVGDAAALANDFDVLVICGSPSNFEDHSEEGPMHLEWAPTFVSFVRDFGRGLLASADYARNCASPADVFAPLNAITEGAGISFLAVNLGYSSMSIDAGCVPDLP